MQAQFVCIANNLTLILEQCLKKEGVENEIENSRRQKRLDNTLVGSKTKKDTLPVFLTTPKRATLLSLKFIRWLQLVCKHFMDGGYGGVEENLRCILIPITLSPIFAVKHVLYVIKPGGNSVAYIIVWSIAMFINEHYLQSISKISFRFITKPLKITKELSYESAFIWVTF